MIRRNTPTQLLATAALLFTLPVLAAADLVRVGVYENDPKLMVTTDGHPSGIFGDLLQAIAEREGWVLQPVTCIWEECLSLLEAGQLDLMPDVALSAERQQRFDFHRTPALHSWSQLFSRDGQNFHSPLDLDRQRIAVLAEGVQLDYLQQLATAFDIHPHILPVLTPQEAFEQVQLGNADLAVSNHLFGNYHARHYGLAPTAILFQPTQLFFAAPAGQGAPWLERIDYWLQQWRSDAGSPYYTILHRWGVGAAREVIPAGLFWAAAIVGLLLLSALGFILLLKYEVRVRTRELHNSERHLSDILSGVQAFIYDKDDQFRYRYANQPLYEFLGLDSESLLGKTDFDVFDRDTADSIRTVDEQVLQQGRRIVIEETVQSPRESEARLFVTVKMPWRNANGDIQGLRSVSTDITEKKQQQEQIQLLSYYDSLTGLPNRRKIHQRLTRAMAKANGSGRNGAILLIDLDDFHDLNDTYSHDLGDRLLQAVAQRLSQLDIPDSLLARFGGDEFIQLLENLSHQRETALLQTEEQLDRVTAALERPYDLGAIAYSCSASVGVAMFSDVGNDLDGLIKGAELAMFTAKQTGKSHFSFYNTSMQTEALRRSVTAEGIRQGLNREEFRLWYQPQYDADNRLLGLEALIRWQHPQKGLVSPLDFIPVAESTGLIIPLGQWILRSACEQLVAWSSHPELGQVRIAVNISARQMRDEHFVAQVRTTLEQTGADAHLLELELTESLLVDDDHKTIDKMMALRSLGIRFTLDDFGTGYSSLLYLKRLPIYKLKIDQGFTRDLLTDPSDAAIVKTIVDLGQNMELQVIAEGVETSQQKEALLAMGCRLYQGYLFSPPLPPEALQQSLLTAED